MPLAIDADAVHAVVPVAAQDQRQAVCPLALDGEIKCQGGMLVDADLVIRNLRTEE